MGCDQQAHVDLARFRRSDSHHQPVGKHAQQLGLRSRRHLAGLVQKQRAFVGGLEQTLAGAVGAGERAALVAEQFAFEQGLGEGGAIDRDERLGGARAAAMDRAGDQFLAGAGLARDQHRGIGRRDARDLLAQRRGLPRCGRGFRTIPPAGPPPARSLPFSRSKRVCSTARRAVASITSGMKRLGDEIERAAPHAFDRKFDRCKRGQENHRHGGVRLARGGQHLESLAVAHLLVGDHGVERVLGERGRACGEARGLDHLVTLPGAGSRRGSAACSARHLRSVFCAIVQLRTRG